MFCTDALFYSRLIREAEDGLTFCKDFLVTVADI